jgi:DNA-binding IclR family transcriptional regulator
VLAGPLPPLASGRVVDLADLRRDLDEVRRTGTAMSRGERFPEIVSIAAPVFDVDGVAGAISLSVREVRFDEAALDQYRRLLTQGAARISSELGGRSPWVEPPGPVAE